MINKSFIFKMIRKRWIKSLIFHPIGYCILAIVFYSTIFVLFYYYIFNPEIHRAKYTVKSNFVNYSKLELSNYTDITSQNSSQLGLQDFNTISEDILKLNSEQKIYNLETFGPVTNSTFVIVIQVHNRLSYLNLLLDCLSQVRQIEQALLIFSHDIFIPSLNEDIQNINFTKVMQIFYPYTYQNENMISRLSDNYSTTKKSNPPKDRKMKGSRGAQIKHHWWWKANFVFHQIEVLKTFKGYISFTEEDTYFTTDALLMFDLIAKEMESGQVCDECQVFTIAEGPRTTRILFPRKKDIEKYDEVATQYDRSIVSIHFALNRTIWMKIKSCDVIFCEYQDYNWDWSLYHLFRIPRCMIDPVKQLLLHKPRVYHTGNCGHHHKGRMCDPAEYASRAQRLSRSFVKLHPRTLHFIKHRLHRARSLPEPWGGWNKNDKELCMTVSRTFGVDDSQKTGNGK